MKRFAAILLSMVMVLSLCACAPSTEDPETTGSAQLSGNPSTAPTTQPAEAPTTQPSEPEPTDPPVEIVPIDPKDHINDPGYYYENVIYNQDANGKGLLIAHNPSGKAIAVSQTALGKTWTLKTRVQFGEVSGSKGDMRIALCTNGTGKFNGLVTVEYNSENNKIRFGNANEQKDGSWVKRQENSGWLDLAAQAAFDLEITREEFSETLVVTFYDVNGKMIYIKETGSFSSGFMDTVTNLGFVSYSSQVQFSNIEIISE